MGDEDVNVDDLVVDVSTPAHTHTLYTATPPSSAHH